MHKKSALFLNFFKFQSSAFLSQVVPFLSHSIIRKDEFVYEIGEFSEDIYFLFRGMVTLEDDNNNALLSLLPGGCFGDIEVFKQINRIFNAKCVQKSSIIVMDFNLLDSIKISFPIVWHEMKVQAYENHKILMILQKHYNVIKNLDLEVLGIKNLKDIENFVDIQTMPDMEDCEK